MILNAYVIYDLKATAYNQPFFAHNHNVAKRMVSDIAGDLNTSVGRHPTDFILYCIGTYDDANAALVPHDLREHIADVITLVPQQPELFKKDA